MNALVELIKKIGIFMIAAQAVIHFAPDIKYAKYMKLIVGIMILLQFLSPVYRIVNGMEADWSAQLANMEQELETAGLSEDFSDSYSALETVTKSMEQEIKSKLNNNLSEDNLNKNYVVKNVMVNIENTADNNGNSAEYILNRIQVVVWECAEDAAGTEHKAGMESTNEINNTTGIEKIQIDKIAIPKDGFEEGNDTASEYSEEKTADSLRRRFCSALGMDEKYMEVRVYGALKETGE